MTIGKACEGIVTFWGTDYRRQTRDVHGKVAAERKRSNSESIGETLVSSIGNNSFIP